MTYVRDNDALQRIKRRVSHNKLDDSYSLTNRFQWDPVNRALFLKTEKKTESNKQKQTG